jgi:GNAT superfamily N-acetyltransferase
VEYQIRWMSPQDARDVSELCTELGYPATPEEIEQRLLRISDIGNHAIFVAEAVGQVLGWIQVHAAASLLSPECAEIGGLIVRQDVRRAGVGRALVAGAEEWATQRRCGLIRVRSNVVRSDAAIFYQALGFKSTKTSCVFEKTLARLGADRRS